MVGRVAGKEGRTSATKRKEGAVEGSPFLLPEKWTMPTGERRHVERGVIRPRSNV